MQQESTSWLDEPHEIFRAGPYYYPGSNIYEVSEQDLRDIVDDFDNRKRQIPQILGNHLTGDLKAYGWIDKLELRRRSDGKLALYQTIKDASPELKEGVRKGHYRNRSVWISHQNTFSSYSFSNWGKKTLLHVCHLGKVAPAIHDLENHRAFSTEEGVDIKSCEGYIETECKESEPSKLSFTTFQPSNATMTDAALQPQTNSNPTPEADSSVAETPPSIAEAAPAKKKVSMRKTPEQSVVSPNMPIPSAQTSTPSNPSEQATSTMNQENGSKTEQSDKPGLSSDDIMRIATAVNEMNKPQNQHMAFSSQQQAQQVQEYEKRLNALEGLNEQRQIQFVQQQKQHQITNLWNACLKDEIVHAGMQKDFYQGFESLDFASNGKGFSSDGGSTECSQAQAFANLLWRVKQGAPNDKGFSAEVSLGADASVTVSTGHATAYPQGFNEKQYEDEVIRVMNTEGLNFEDAAKRVNGNSVKR